MAENENGETQDLRTIVGRPNNPAYTTFYQLQRVVNSQLRMNLMLAKQAIATARSHSFAGSVIQAYTPIRRKLR